MSKIVTMVGPMGSGKSATLIEGINIMDTFNPELKILVFKPVMDTRTPGIISSRNGKNHKAIEITSFDDILSIIKKEEVNAIFIDELQFIHIHGLKDLIIECHKREINIYSFGLDLTSEFDIFVTTAQFMGYSTDIIKITGECDCGGRSIMTMFIGGHKDGAIQIGNSEYIGVCENCYELTKK